MPDLPPVGASVHGGAVRPPGDRDVIADKAREFEAVFLGQVMSQMMSTVDTGSFGGGYAEETWRSFLAQEYGRQIAESGGIGISESIESALRSYKVTKSR